MLFYLVTALYVLVCFTMMLVVYLQQGKGGDIASAFGGGGSSQSAFGARAGATVLSKATAVLAALFMIVALALAIIGQRGPGSIISGSAPPRPASAPAKPAPAGSAPAPASSRPAPAPAGSPAPATPAPTPTTPK